MSLVTELSVAVAHPVLAPRLDSFEGRGTFGSRKQVEFRQRTTISRIVGRPFKQPLGFELSSVILMGAHARKTVGSR